MSMNLGLSVNARGGYRVQPITGISATYAAVFGLRRVVPGYNSALARCWRSIDASAIDIGMTANGQLDAASVMDFASGGDAGVHFWYDQSGNGRTASENSVSFTNKPRLVIGGVLQTQNGRPALRFEPGQTLSTNAFTAFSSGFTRCIVGGVVSDTAFPTFGGKTNGAFANPFDMYSSSFWLGTGVTGGSAISLTTAIAAASGFRQWSFSGSSSVREAYTNGANNRSATGTSGYGDSASTAIILGSRADAFTSLDGYISEDVYLTTAVSTTDRQIIERNQGQFFGIAVA